MIVREAGLATASSQGGRRRGELAAEIEAEPQGRPGQCVPGRAWIVFQLGGLARGLAHDPQAVEAIDATQQGS